MYTDVQSSVSLILLLLTLLLSLDFSFCLKVWKVPLKVALDSVVTKVSTIAWSLPSTIVMSPSFSEKKEELS